MLFILSFVIFVLPINSIKTISQNLATDCLVLFCFVYYNSLLLSFYIAVSDFHSKCIADNNCIDTATFFLPCTLTSTYSSIDSTCIGWIVCNVARKKDGKIEVTSQETLDTDDNLPFSHQQTIMLQKYEQTKEHKM